MCWCSRPEDLVEEPCTVGMTGMVLAGSLIAGICGLVIWVSKCAKCLSRLVSVMILVWDVLVGDEESLGTVFEECDPSW